MLRFIQGLCVGILVLPSIAVLYALVKEWTESPRETPKATNSSWYSAS